MFSVHLSWFDGDQQGHVSCSMTNDTHIGTSVDVHQHIGTLYRTQANQSNTYSAHDVTPISTAGCICWHDSTEDGVITSMVWLLPLVTTTS